jgi:hypothetical protein
MVSYRSSDSHDQRICITMSRISLHVTRLRRAVDPGDLMAYRPGGEGPARSALGELSQLKWPLRENDKYNARRTISNRRGGDCLALFVSHSSKVQQPSMSRVDRQVSWAPGGSARQRPPCRRPSSRRSGYGGVRASPQVTAAKFGGSGLLLEGLEGGQAERVPGRVGVDTAMAVWLVVVLRGTGR